jgi:hypothetical protein
MRRRIHALAYGGGYMCSPMRRRIHVLAYEERRIHALAYEEEDTCARL